MMNSRLAQTVAARFINSRCRSSCMAICTVGGVCLVEHTDERAGLAKTIDFGSRAFEESGKLFGCEHSQELGPLFPRGFGFSPSHGPILQVLSCPVNNLR